MIAMAPLLFHHFWESDKNKLFFISILCLPVIIYLLLIKNRTDSKSVSALLHGITDFLCFMSLIGSLYVVSGGIILKFKWKSTPFLNSLLLGFGALLTNLLGTTGASILLFKPYIHANRERNYKTHLALFFIFIVGNMGGLLTPLGDPPLFLGFLNGIDFFWTFSLWPQWLIANLYLLIAFFTVDFYYFKKEKQTLKVFSDDDDFHFFGKSNFIFLGILLMLVLMQSPTIGKTLGEFAGFLLPVNNLTLGVLPAAICQIFIAGIAYARTPKLIRKFHGFSWAPLTEVGILFLGIFITMIPAMEYLRQTSVSMPLKETWKYFWLTGILSSVLDNAPTFLAFATLAAGTEGIGSLPAAKPLILSAICCGSVFMGANSYIGNGPNFLIKAMAEANHIKMPSFFHYSMLSFALFLPLYLLLTFLFFL